MAVGRITGQMLNATLNRVTSDLTIRSTGEANLLQIDTSNQRIGVATASPTVPLDVTGAIKGSSTITATTSVTGGTMTIAGGSLTDTSGAISFGNENLTTTGQINTSGVRLLENEITTIRSNDDLILSANGSGGVQIEGSLTVSADLTVNGSTTTVNSTTLTVDDKNIELAHSPSGASSSDTLADGGGLILKGSTDHTILWNNSTDDWDFSETIDVASGKVYKVNGTEVLSGTTITTVNAVHNVISSSDSSSVRINDGLLVDGSMDVGSTFSISNTTGITAILDEDNMASNSATSLSTQQSIKAYVDSQTAAAGVLTVIDDSSSAVSVTIADDDLKIAGGANITTSASGDTITVALDAAVSGLTNLTVDNLNVNGNTITASSGDITLAPAAGGDVNIGANLGLTFGDDGEKIEGNGTDLTIASGNNIDLTATTDVNIPVNVGLTFATAEKIESDGTDLTITVGAGGDINIGSAIGLTFGDDGEKIEGDGTDLTIASSNDLNLTATTDINVPANVGMTFGDDGEKIEGDGTDLTISSSAKLNLTATSDVHIPQAVGLVFDTAGTEKIESDGTDLTISVGAGGDINIPASIGLKFGDDGEGIEGDGTDLTISSSGVLNLTATGNTAVTNNLTVGGTVAVSGTEISVADINIGVAGITTDSNADLVLNPGGTGVVVVDALKSNDSSVINIKDGLDIDGTFSLNAGTTVNQILDEDNMASDSATALATQQSIKAFVEAQLTASDLDFQGDAGGALSIDLDSEVLDIAGGANITTTGSSNTLTVALDAALTGLTSVQIDSLNLQDNSITSDSNADIEITPGGTGNTVFSKSDNQIILPIGNTAARNGNIEGSIRYNSETGNFEGYSASGWGGLGGGDLTAVDDSSTTISVTLSQNSVKFAGGANITTSVSGTTITTALDTALTGLTDLTVDNLNVNGNTITASSGDITLAPAASGDVNIGANLGLTFGNDGEKIEGDGTDLTISSSAKLNLTATTDIQVPANVGVLFGTGGEKIESDGTDLTATITGNFVFNGTGAVDVPVGTTAQRPTVNTGLIRFNSTLGVYEGSTDGSTYSSFLMAAAGEAADINKDVFTTSNDSTTAFTLSFTPAEAQNVLVFVDNIFQESTNNYTVSGTTLTMTAALHNGARLVVLHGFDGSGGVSGATWIGGTNTDIDSALENVDTFTTSTYRAAEYTYLATNAEGTGDSTTGHETGKILIVHDGSTAQMTQYGITHTSTAPVLTFSVDIDSGSVRLRAASIAANTKVRFARLGLAPL